MLALLCRFCFSSVVVDEVGDRRLGERLRKEFCFGTKARRKEG